MSDYSNEIQEVRKLVGDEISEAVSDAGELSQISVDSDLLIYAVCFACDRLYSLHQCQKNGFKSCSDDDA
jgi:hypothetical protein